jgi:hypothetical protein
MEATATRVLYRLRLAATAEAICQSDSQCFHGESARFGAIWPTQQSCAEATMAEDAEGKMTDYATPLDEDDGAMGFRILFLQYLKQMHGSFARA